MRMTMNQYFNNHNSNRFKSRKKIIKELKHTARDINEMTIDAIDAEI